MDFRTVILYSATQGSISLKLVLGNGKDRLSYQNVEGQDSGVSFIWPL
ncbi:Uncharacterised protein [Mycobacterium tuberculosis]|nr:Uncharacterised protein [Mycobacterium tuberculosis]